MGKWNDHRDAVNAILQKKGRSKYWLAKQLSNKIAPASIYDYLRGTSDIKYEKRKAIDRVLGLRYSDE